MPGTYRIPSNAEQQKSMVWCMLYAGYLLFLFEFIAVGLQEVEEDLGVAELMAFKELVDERLSEDHHKSVEKEDWRRRTWRNYELFLILCVSWYLTS